MEAEVSSQVVGWLSFAVTTIGLGGLISQANAINDKMDPFHASRTAEYLGIWFQRQAPFPWWTITKPPPRGPSIKASMADGFCAAPVLHITRIPLLPTGKAGWSIIMSMFNPDVIPPKLTASEDDPEKGMNPSARKKITVGDSKIDGWKHLEQRNLSRYKSNACVVMSRTTLITMLVITNGRPVFHYSDASGLRAGYASYCGQWYITWPIGQEAIVKFAPHDSIGATEVLPRSFPQRVDRCGQIVCGVVTSISDDFNVAFCGRKAPGTYRLDHSEKGFQGAHGSRHLYNMMGGKAFQVDYMYARPMPNGLVAGDESLVLTLPSTEKNGIVQMVVPKHEEEIIHHALDCLPWTSLSWSIHRGMRDILMAYTKPVMDAHREQLAAMVKKTVAEQPHELDARGWDPTFVRNNMAHMAASAILAGVGNSGDSVRVVADIIAVMVGNWDTPRLDNVKFWRTKERTLNADGIVALTKVFVLEWSIEFDYQMYHNLPMTLYFG